MFKSSKNTTDGSIQKAIERFSGFETTLADIHEKNGKRAWIAAGIPTFSFLCLLGGLFYTLSLKRKEPRLVMTDVYTGQTTVAKLVGDWSNLDITKNEAINKNSISHFIIVRESFDSRIIYDNDWATVYSISVAGVPSSYRNLMSESNPNSPFNLHGSAQSIRVKTLSTVLNNSGKADGRDASTTVRLQRFLLNKSTGISGFIDSSVATLTHIYNSNSKMDGKYKLENPPGLQVPSYRVGPDASKSPIRDLSPDYLSAGTPSESQTQQQIQSVPQLQLEAPTSVDNDAPNASPISVENGNQ